MRTHTALHVLCGVVWAEFGIPVTGGNMEPGSGRLDFPLESISAELGRHVGERGSTRSWRRPGPSSSSSSAATPPTPTRP